MKCETVADLPAMRFRFSTHGYTMVHGAPVSRQLSRVAQSA